MIDSSMDLKLVSEFEVPRYHAPRTCTGTKAKNIYGLKTVDNENFGSYGRCALALALLPQQKLNLRVRRTKQIERLQWSAGKQVHDTLKACNAYERQLGPQFGAIRHDRCSR